MSSRRGQTPPPPPPAPKKDVSVPTKHDGEKVRYDLVPAVALREVAEVFTFGAKKYSEHNYLGLEKARIFSALLRHVYAWWLGEELDEESGKSHLAHAACCVLMLRHQETEEAQPEKRN